MTAKTDTLLSRRQIAAILGISEGEVKQRDNTVFHPTKAADGSFRYSINELLSALRSPTGHDGETASDGATFAKAFVLFSEGKNLMEAVIALQQPPAVVRALRAEFDSMAGTLTIPIETVALIEAASKKAVRNADQLLELFDSLRTERSAAYEQGLEDANNYGDVLDPRTGQLVPLNKLTPSDRHGPPDLSPSAATPRRKKDNR